MKFNYAYSQMFPGYPDAVSLQQAAEMLGLNRHTAVSYTHLRAHET